MVIVGVGRFAPPEDVPEFTQNLHRSKLLDQSRQSLN